MTFEQIEQMLQPRRFDGALRLLPGETELPVCLQGSFWTEFAENLGAARLLGFEIVTLMDEVINLKKDGKPIPDDFNQRKREAIEKWRVACEVCQDKALVIWKAANGK